MEYSVQDIVVEVRKALDENESFALFIEDVDTLSMNAIIEQKIPDAVRSVTKEAPTHLLDGGIPFATTINWESGVAGKGMGYTLLPDDFMRLVIFQMSDWRRPVLVHIEDSDPVYLLQKSKYIGIRGGIDKPVCAVTTYPAGKVMELYSCVGGATVSVKVAKYLPYPSIKNGKIDICRRLFTPILYYTAGLVCLTLKDKAQADNLFAVANDFLK